jgi:transketolase
VGRHRGRCRARSRLEPRFAAYRAAFPAEAAEFERRMAATCRPTLTRWCKATPSQAFGDKPEAVASRKSSQKVLAALAPQVPEMLGGSADLTGSNLTDFPGCGAAPHQLRRA